MAEHEQRIAWLLTAKVLERDGAVALACLTVAAQAGFRVVAMDDSPAVAGIRPQVEADASRLGLRCILVNEEVHWRIDSSLCDADRLALAQTLSRDGFDGLILCDACDSHAVADSLLARARVLLRDLDQVDWETHH